MKIRVIWIGKTKDSGLATLAVDFVSRIRRFLPIEIKELRDSRVGMQDEGEKLLAALDPNDRVVVLDVKGQAWSSAQFAEFVGKHMRSEPRHLTFVIGGYEGLAAAVKKRADQAWSLSPLTFTHDMTRVVVLEQIYRALAILNNHPYAK